MNNFGKKLADEQYQHRKIIATVDYNSFRNSNVDSKTPTGYMYGTRY